MDAVADPLPWRKRLPGEQVFQALTVTLKPEYYVESGHAFEMTARQQFNFFKPILQSILHRTCDKYSIIAELTKKGNVHFHGTILKKKCRKPWLYEISTNGRLTRWFGWLEDTDIYDSSGWYQYAENDLLTTAMTAKRIGAHPYFSESDWIMSASKRQNKSLSPRRLAKRAPARPKAETFEAKPRKLTPGV